MAEPKVESSRLVITIKAGEECFLVPCERAIVGTKGIFVRNLQLVVGTRVVVQFCKKPEAMSVLGVVCANYPDLGLAIEFEEKTGSAARQLVTLQVA